MFDKLNAGSYTLEAGKLAVGAQSQSITVEATLGRTTAARMDIPNNDLPVRVSSILPQMLMEQGNNDSPSVLRNAAGVQDGVRQEGNRFNTQLNNVEQVDILRGPGSVLYGPSALGGVINIMTLQVGGGINDSQVYPGSPINVDTTFRVRLGALK